MGIIGQILLEVKIFDLGCNLESTLIRGYIDMIGKVTIDQGCVAEELIVEYMIPSSRSSCITPIKAEQLTVAQIIFTEVSGQVNRVFVVDTVIYFGIQIIKVQFTLVDCFIIGQLQEQISIGTSSTDHERTLILDNRCFQL